MRLLFDQNLSPRLVDALADLHGGSSHVRNEGLRTADDDTVWAYAARQGFVIVSKDADFQSDEFRARPSAEGDLDPTGQLLDG